VQSASGLNCRQITGYRSWVGRTGSFTRFFLSALLAFTATGMFTDELLGKCLTGYRRVRTLSTPANTAVHYRHGRDTSICLDLLTSGITQMKTNSLVSYRDLFQAVRNKVYSPSVQIPGRAGPLTSLTPPTVSEFSGSVESLPVVSAEDANITGDAYLNQVDDLLDEEMFDMDDSLSAWYSSMLDEMRTQRPEIRGQALNA
jgi:hypothetical protein